ncbi:MAG: hypothetical protein U0V70_11390 [Terriglobia bacterium]
MKVQRIASMIHPPHGAVQVSKARNSASVWMIPLLLILFPPQLKAEIRLPVEHEHAFKNCKGELLFTDDRVEYVTKDAKHGRVWSYIDIQQLGLMDSTHISLLSYEDMKWEMGKDRRYRFVLTEGTVPQSLAPFLQGRLTRPLVVGIHPGPFPGKFEIPVKHLHAWGGCQGILKIGEDSVSYETTNKEDSRLWRIDTLESVGTTGPYQLRLTTMERTGSEISSEKNFIFELKQRLDPAAYDFLWWKINGPQIHAQK